MFTVNPDFLFKITYNIWLKSDQTTDVHVLTTPVPNRGSHYNADDHSITICPAQIDWFSKLPVIVDIDPVFVAKCVVAHELGHSVMDNYNANENWNWLHENRNTAKKEILTAFFQVHKKIILRTEVLAWRNARSFLDPDYPINDFYRIARRCLIDYNYFLKASYNNYFVNYP